MNSNIWIAADKTAAAGKIADELSRLGLSASIISPETVRKGLLKQLTCDVLICHDSLCRYDDYRLLAHPDVQNHKVSVIVAAEDHHIESAVRAMQRGAADYLLSPIDPELLNASISYAMGSRMNRSRPEHPEKKTKEGASSHQLITQNRLMTRLIETALKVAPSQAAVLIQGESGTGKEVLARYIHQHSGRSNRQMVSMNCAALPEQLAESELFGFEKGSFTGAFKRKHGKFEQAHQSTLLLDEVSEMPLALQAKLLRVLQEKELERIGGDRPIVVDCRVIATCNRDLRQHVMDGHFREDLYYRLRVIPLQMPALRHHADDIPLLVDYFLQRFCPPGEKTPEVPPDTMKALLNWSWPGNVRELENTIQRAMLMGDGNTIHPQDLMLETVNDSMDLEVNPGVGMTVRDMEKQLIQQTLRHVNDNRTHAAKMLGISIRTLRNKLHEYRNSDPATIAAIS